jgi:hypothetical protein
MNDNCLITNYVLLPLTNVIIMNESVGVRRTACGTNGKVEMIGVGNVGIN